MFCYSCYLERGLEFLLKAAGSSLLSLHVEDCGVFITDRCIRLMILILTVSIIIETFTYLLDIHNDISSLVINKLTLAIAKLNSKFEKIVYKPSHVKGSC